ELKAGPAKLMLLARTKAPVPRQIDIIVLTTDASYRPRIKDQPHNPAWDILQSYRKNGIGELEPLARRKIDATLPESWKLRSFKDRGFFYLWNMSPDGALKSWLSDDPMRVKFPYAVA